MPREQRVEYAGAIYHAMARGNRRGDIVLNDEDRNAFVGTLAEVVESSGWVMYAWVLMSNHFHLLLETPEPNLVTGMKWLLGTYGQGWNARRSLGRQPVAKRRSPSPRCLSSATQRGVFPLSVIDCQPLFSSTGTGTSTSTNVRGRSRDQFRKDTFVEVHPLDD